MADPYPPPVAPPVGPSLAPPTQPVPRPAPPARRLSPLWQTAVVCFVGLTVAGAMVVMSLFTRNLFVPLSLAATLIAVAVGIYAAIQGWKGSQLAAARGARGRSALIALVAGAMLIVSAVGLSGAIWIVLLFFL